MADATRIQFGTQQLLIGNGATPEVFTAPCGLTTLTRTTNVETQTVMVPDCDDPFVTTWMQIDEISRQMIVTGSGLLSAQYLLTWREWDLAGGFKNARWYTNLTAPNGGGYLAGRVLLTQFEETAEFKRSYQVSIQLTFDGKPTWSPAS